MNNNRMKTPPDLTRCIHCGKWINPALGADPPSDHQEARGTKADPYAPGDYDNVCALCNYGRGLRGHAKR